MSWAWGVIAWGITSPGAASSIYLPCQALTGEGSLLCAAKSRFKADTPSHAQLPSPVAMGEQPCWLSSLGVAGGCAQSLAASWGDQTVPSRTMALAMVRSLRIQATMATLVGLPRAHNRW